MPEAKNKPTSKWIKQVERKYQSQLMLGALIALLTVANGFVAFRSTRASLDSSTVDFWASRAMLQASISHLSGNARYAVDTMSYNGYRLLEIREPELAEDWLNRSSEELLAGMKRPAGPFDEEYLQTQYGEARKALAEAAVLYEKADQASAESERYALASSILTIGLGATAWAALLREQNVLRFVFAVTAWLSLIVGLIAAFAAG